MPARFYADDVPGERLHRDLLAARDVILDDVHLRATALARGIANDTTRALIASLTVDWAREIDADYREASQLLREASDESAAYYARTAETLAR